MKLFRQLFFLSATTLFLLSTFSVIGIAHDPSGNTTSVHVSLFEWGISLDKTSVPAGPVLFEIVNDGNAPHAFKIGGVSIGTTETDVFQPGSVREITVDLPAGSFELWCPIPGHRENGMETTITVEAGPTELPPPNSRSVRDFDTDGNCFISDAEFFDAIDMWVDSGITNELFFDVVDAWVSESSVCAAVASVLSSGINVSMNALQGVSFVAQDADATLLSVQIFDLQGQLIADLSSSSRQLRWNLRKSSGARIANGVYFYHVVLDSGRSEVRKFVVMR